MKHNLLKHPAAGEPLTYTSTPPWESHFSSLTYSQTCPRRGGYASLRTEPFLDLCRSRFVPDAGQTRTHNFPKLSTEKMAQTDAKSNTEGGDCAKKAIITGITGQDGSYLAEFLLEKVSRRNRSLHLTQAGTPAVCRFTHSISNSLSCSLYCLYVVQVSCR